MYQQGAPDADAGAGAQGAGPEAGAGEQPKLIKKMTMLLMLILKKFN